MKLKKIASLALAGVMAVSMLAGCATGTGSSSSSSSSTVAVSSTVLQNTLKTAQNGNDVVIDFTMNDGLAKFIQTKLKDATNPVAATDIKTAAETEYTGGTSYNKTLDGTTLNANTVTAGTYYSLELQSYTGVSEDKACMDFAKTLFTSATTNPLKASFKGQVFNSGDADMKATYTGYAAIVPFTAYDGTVTYYVATLVETTVEKA